MKIRLHHACIRPKKLLPKHPKVENLGSKDCETFKNQPLQRKTKSLDRGLVVGDQLVGALHVSAAVTKTATFGGRGIGNVAARGREFEGDVAAIVLILIAAVAFLDQTS